MQLHTIDRTTVRDIAPLLLDQGGKLQVVPSLILQKTTAQERLVFGVQKGLYSFPTVELGEFLREQIGGRRAIEIGAGHGALAAWLGIPATGNRQQEEPRMRAHYANLRQPTVPYGVHVEKLDANEAVRKYAPQVVIGCWVTHRYDARRPQAGGSETGIDEGAIIDACEEYIVVGNEEVHRHKPICERPAAPP